MFIYISGKILKEDIFFNFFGISMASLINTLINTPDKVLTQGQEVHQGPLSPINWTTTLQKEKQI